MGPFTSLLSLMAAAFQANTADGVVWHWDRETPTCVLRQETFPGGDTIEIGRTPANGATGVTITTRSRTRLREVQIMKGAITLDSAGQTVADVFQQGDPDEQHLNTSASTEDSGFMAKLANASTLEISGGGIRPARITLKSAAAAVQALRNCEDAKMRQWGVDAGAWNALKAKPMPLKPIQELFSANDYPDAALDYSVQGDAIIRLDVGSDGTVRSCKSVNPAKYRGFEYASCNMLRRARFQPALDAADHPVSAPYIFYVSFRMR